MRGLLKIEVRIGFAFVVSYYRASLGEHMKANWRRGQKYR